MTNSIISSNNESMIRGICTNNHPVILTWIKHYRVTYSTKFLTRTSESLTMCNGGGDLFDMAKDGTTVPEDAAKPRLIPSKPRPDQIASEPDVNSLGASDLAGAADNAQDIPRVRFDCLHNTSTAPCSYPACTKSSPGANEQENAITVYQRSSYPRHLDRYGRYASIPNRLETPT